RHVERGRARRERPRRRGPRHLPARRERAGADGAPRGVRRRPLARPGGPAEPVAGDHAARQGDHHRLRLSVGLQQAGLTLDDLNIQPITFPDMVGALANGSVDAAMMVEPFLSRAVQQGTAVRAIGLGDIYPNFTIATLGFADSLYSNRPAAKGFVRAYLRAVRDYLAAEAGPPGDAA